MMKQCEYKLFTLGVYQPVSCNKIILGITAAGRIGIWRLLHSDYMSNTKEIIPKLKGWNVQPEVENFILTELTIGIMTSF